ncbi:MAG: cytochrome P460 family protein [Acidobacteriaceae bacterium]
MAGAWRTVGGLAVVVVAVGLVAQAIRPSLGEPAGPQVEVAVPPQVREILVRRCYACHSDEPQLVWWDEVAPMRWVVASDVKRARAVLNFSELGTKPAGVQRAELYESVNQIALGAMPLRLYLLGHPHAGVTAEELAVLKIYLVPFAPTGKAGGVAASVVPKHLMEPAEPSLNGVPFLPGFADWRVMSTTDRGDNHTLRIITANDVAMRAIEQHTLPSWPEGAAFAKITWQAVDDGHGHVVPGKFVQVEFMEKHRVQYAGTGGWGFARFKGDDLKPYGKGAHFDNECLGCHEPVRGNDYVYTLPLPRAAVQSQGVGR